METELDSERGELTVHEYWMHLNVTNWDLQGR